MKILSLILDGHGRLTAELCVSPDLRRREIVAATGGGEIIWCGLATHSQPPSEVLAELRAYIESRCLERWDRPSLRAAVRRAYLATVISPVVDRARGRLLRAIRRPVTGPVDSLRSSLAPWRRTP